MIFFSKLYVGRLKEYNLKIHFPPTRTAYSGMCYINGDTRLTEAHSRRAESRGRVNLLLTFFGVQCPDDCSVHKIHTDIPLMCELYLTMKLCKQHRACRMLSHSSSQFRTICFRADCLISVPLHNNI